MQVFSYMKENPWKTVKVVGLLSSAIATAAAAYYFYRRSKYEPLVQDITEEQELQYKYKSKLKAMLRSDHIHCADLDRVEEVIDSLILDGVSQLQVVADFDRTLTRVSYNGETVPSCHGVVESCTVLPDWFIQKADEMRDYYMAIEFDPKLTREQKYPYMEEWVDKAHELLVTTKLKHQDLKESVSKSNVHLREGSDEMMAVLHEHGIPFLIFSAGVGNVIEEVLKQRYHLHDNTHIIANWMDFDQQGVLVGFKGENIHVYNKNTHAIENASYFDNISHRHNVILMGDSLGDLDIAEGIPHQENLLTIGFLNQHVEASLEQYKSRYDVVICEDDTMNLVNCLLLNIIVNSQQ